MMKPIYAVNAVVHSSMSVIEVSLALLTLITEGLKARHVKASGSYSSSAIISKVP